MIRTQVYLPELAHQKLVRLAQAKGESMANLIREFVELGLEHKAHTDTSGKTALRSLLEIGATGGPTDLSSNHNFYLYGDSPTEK